MASLERKGDGDFFVYNSHMHFIRSITMTSGSVTLSYCVITSTQREFRRKNVTSFFESCRRKRTYAYEFPCCLCHI